MSKNKENNNYMAGKLLLAMPAMGDQRFHKAVILMCAHDEKGAMGLVINHVLPGIELHDLFQQLNIDMNEETMKKASQHPVMGGGPVETARGFILHSNDFEQDDTIKIDDTINVTGTIDALHAVATDNGPEKMLFILGYAGWSAGQLDQEIQQNAWLITEADPELIFDIPVNDKWDQAVQTLGFDPAMLSGDAGHA